MFPRLLAASLILTLSGCGRIAATGPAPAAPLGLAEAPAPAAEGLAGVEAKVRPHLGRHREAPAAMVAVGPVRENGELANTLSAGWEVGFWVPGEGSHRYRTVRLDALGRGQLRSAFGEIAVPPPGLTLSALPEPREAIARARAAGLPEGQRYEVEYLATSHGPIMRVSSRPDAKATKQVTLDLSSGEIVEEVRAAAAFQHSARHRRDRR